MSSSSQRIPNSQFPVPNSLPSYWRKQPAAIDNHRSTTDLVSAADIVVIGAGYSGASIVHHLAEESLRAGKATPSIVILEAREACSGATGRNGGHLKPDPLLRPAGLLDSHGAAVAEHVASFEQRQVAAIKELVERERIDCDFEETTVMDICKYAQGRDKMKASIDKVTKAGISTAKMIRFYTGREAEEVSGVRGALSCHTYSGARLAPYRLVTHLLQKAVNQGVNLQTFTPVESVRAIENDAQGFKWAVDTCRGTVKTKTVIFATNGYTSALVPEMKGKIVPVRGMVAHITAPNAPQLKHSYMMRLSDFEYDYMIPRPDDSVVVGGGRRDFYKNLDDWFDVVDDSKLIDAGKEYYDGYMQRHFPAWENSGACTQYLWTGIMGYSNDEFPYVGPACGRPGQYVCAGFTGHGMPQIFLSAKAVAVMALTGDTENVDLPLPYRITPERWSEQNEHAARETWERVQKNQPVLAAKL
ncbi:hypothetical protein COCC4DRAFT_154574 [Bipolaris maydis ATCC 48331]|uniref:FAD dependent oxidoreductase domain-containing protein n=2 Tax=Cochliobolus heterostrophus TaxID=5016 RepID=M2TEF1_COCH5|nr:uncharacterized protein COCC4DRAFT_154574 [Bipolaris maydis ATCC 48331]EMD84899.1 hypothetical protein COCHEDRAFT_1161818 [Bipolaris maydis C5]KAH7564376.1 hypothetical protein BM1_01423 [Bipolaris maydis]ENH98896.1 hypothetical protein COCC4DRAFT_154574 [Bipolaris maydis ATCC 48331]KAJ5026998.1 FAD dependent oxidoreductase [Bipolaris maydis]KAJ5059249.1 FAD dependent oxidoreductase [Bipolaris maydis]